MSVCSLSSVVCPVLDRVIDAMQTKCVLSPILTTAQIKIAFHFFRFIGIILSFRPQGPQ